MDRYRNSRRACVAAACLLALGGILTGCATIAEPGTAAQPILYLDVEGDTLLVRGVYLDASRVTLRIARYDPLRAMPMSSRDARWLAYVTGDRESGRVVLELGDLGGGNKTILALEKTDVIAHPIWSPDGRSLALLLLDAQHRSPFIVVVDPGDQQHRSQYRVPLKLDDLGAARQVRPSFRWSPDGRKILVAMGAGAFVVDIANGVVETVANAPVLAEWSSSSDGVYLAEVSGAATDPDYLGSFSFRPLGPATSTRIMDRERIKALGLADIGASIRGTMRLSPKGSRLVLWGSRTNADKVSSVIHVYDLTGGQTGAFDRAFKTARIDEELAAVEWGPDDHSLAAVTMADGGIRIKVLDLRTGAWRTLARVAEGVSAEQMQVIGMIYSLHHEVMTWAQ
jgi:hypothetical protein